MKITDWLGGFIDRHQSRHPRSDWPKTGSQSALRIRTLWLENFLSLDPRPKESEAEGASRSIKGEVLGFPEDHVTAVCQAVIQARSKPATVAAPALSREAAVMSSAACEQCGGHGLVTVYHDSYEGCAVGWLMSEQGEVKTAALTVPAHCTCPYGRWMRSRLSEVDRKRVLDLEQLPAGWSANDPRLVGVEFSQFKASDWRAMVEALADRMGVGS